MQIREKLSACAEGLPARRAGVAMRRNSRSRLESETVLEAPETEGKRT